ncbi:hypothetical protein [Streptomyces sp. NPDC017230]|uniref:hypothetical protein n=1 Tax=unclassified Streptomyces TaxID=2593676 RepID=UPI0037A2B6ED
MTSYSVTPWIDTPQERTSAAALLGTSGRSWHPFVVPGRYTHLEVKKAGENGVARWQLDRLRPDDVPPLPASVAGHGTQLFTWEGGELELRYESVGRTRGFGVRHQAFDSGEPLDTEVTGTERGTVRLSGPGYVWVSCLLAGDWTLEVV